MYNTPELRLVGAAQTLVLGESLLIAGSIACDNPVLPDVRDSNDEAYQDISSW